MDYFIFNDHSVEFDENITHIDNCLTNFFKIYDKSKKNNFKTIRVISDFDKGWYSLKLNSELTLREWLSSKPRDYQTKIKTIIQSTQFINQSDYNEYSEECLEYSYYGKEVKTLGLTHFLSKISLSFNSSDMWNNNLLELNCCQIINQDNVLVEKEVNVNVKNVSKLEHWIELNELIINRATNESPNYEEKLLILEKFDKIIFTNKGYNCLKKIDNEFFKEVVSVLNGINNKLDELDEITFSKFEQIATDLKFSDESDSVKSSDKLKELRKVYYKECYLYFFYHLKCFNNGRRLHFDIIDGMFVVGYFGNHLKTKKY
ncbi:hypothetical protein [Empedobacter brevis]|uniref:hypothetical protein n=1 Tax=Empedobacter brevis TaxID=247 RepID=UPI0028983D83|nr:hypothetical protein [Empedobacter brevis]